MLLKIKLIVCFCLLCCGVLQSQTIYSIDDFMMNHILIYGKEDINDKESSEQYILFNKITKDVILEFGDCGITNNVSAVEINGALQTIDFANATPASYKELKDINIRYTKDFNFDGIKDIVIDSPVVEDEGCYNPIAESYIFLSKGNTFEYNEPVSDIYNNIYCLRGGSLEVDKKTKTILTIAPSGAGHHYIEKYQWKNGIPVLTKTIEE